MTLTYFGVGVLLAGVAMLAGLLFVIQRLRVRHREVEVLTTIFWRAVVEERRASVFKRRFRHLPAYLLLLAIASLLWWLAGGPAFDGGRNARHIVLVDASAGMSQPGAFDQAVEAARELAQQLPDADREVWLVGGHIDPVLARNEPWPLLDARLGDRAPSAAPGGFEAALRTIHAGIGDAPVHVYLVGSAPVDDDLLENLPESITVERIAPRQPALANGGVIALGVAEAASGAWETVDVSFRIAPDTGLDLQDTVAVQLDGQPLTIAIERSSGGDLIIRDVPARGGTLTVRLLDANAAGAVALDDEASIVLPDRPLIRVSVDDDAPAPLRLLLELDAAVRIVEDPSQAEVRVGSSIDADWRLIGGDAGPAIQLAVGDADPNAIAQSLIDDLAIAQIDAATLAEQIGREIRLDIIGGDARQVSIWRDLLEPSYGFVQSRAWPVFVAKSIRFLANRPKLVPFAAAGEMLPLAGAVAERPGAAGEFRAIDGSVLQASLQDQSLVRLDDREGADETIDVSGGLDLFGLVGVVLLIAFACEWVLHQRGRMP